MATTNRAITIRFPPDLYDGVHEASRLWASRESISPEKKMSAWIQRALSRAVEAERLAAVRAERAREGEQ